jgi:hypothetical protein
MLPKPDLFDQKVSELREKLTDLGVTNASLPDVCFRCRQPRPASERTCKSCNAEFWCEWMAEWYESRLTQVSLGQDHCARRLGNAFAASATASLLIAAAVTHHQASATQAPLGIFFALILGFLSIHEVWAYCHGKTTVIDNCIHIAKPANTSLRTIGLILDFGVLAMAFYILFSIR